MRRWPGKLSLVAFLALGSILLSLSFWGAAAQAGAVAGMVTPAQYREAQAGGSMEISIRSDEGAPYPPGELLLSDPEARMSGSDARGTAYREIPGARYLREGGTFRLDVGNAVSGTYSLRVIGVDSGKYLLNMTGYDLSGARAKISFTALLEPGQVHHYLIDYSNLAGARIRARRTHISE